MNINVLRIGEGITLQFHLCVLHILSAMSHLSVRGEELT